MTITQTPTAGLTPAPLPAYARMSAWCDLSGVSRSETYRRLASGELVAVKVGRSVLIDVTHGLAWLRTRPQAQIGGARQAA